MFSSSEQAKCISCSITSQKGRQVSLFKLIKVRVSNRGKFGGLENQIILNKHWVYLNAWIGCILLWYFDFKENR